MRVPFKLKIMTDHIKILGKFFKVYKGGPIGVWDSYKYIIFGNKPLTVLYENKDGRNLECDNSFIWERILGYLPGASIEVLEEAYSLDGDGYPVNYLAGKFNLPVDQLRGWINAERTKKIWLEGAPAFTPEVEQLKTYPAEILHNGEFAYIYCCEKAIVLRGNNIQEVKPNEWTNIGGKFYRLDSRGNFEALNDK